MITEYRQSKIDSVCLAYVAGLFSDFVNPKNRGPKFTWKGFIDMCAEHSKDWLFVHLARVTDEEYKYARKVAQGIASGMLLRSGLLEEHND